MAENTKYERACGIDYESEYNRIREEFYKSQEENKCVVEHMREMREELTILRAKMDVVNLIFGGANRG